MYFKPAAESNTAGFFTNDTCFMPLIAMPASKRPGLRVLRGSLLLGYVCADTMVGTTVVASSRMEPRIIRIEVCSGLGTWGDSLWGELRQQAPHDADFGGLGRDDIIGEDIGIHFLAGARGLEEVVDHLERAGVVLDHAVEKEPVEGNALRLAQRLELVVGEHAVHPHVVPGGRVRGELPVPAEPPLHDVDLGQLRLVDLPRELEHLRIGAIRLRHPRHHDGLGVVGDHALHELDVRLGIERARWDDDLGAHAVLAVIHARHRILSEGARGGAGEHADNGERDYRTRSRHAEGLPKAGPANGASRRRVAQGEAPAIMNDTWWGA